MVVHDDIDLPLGAIKMVKNHGSAGHKGVQSIIEALGTKDFIRVRLGIKPQIKPQETDRFVLQKFTRKENQVIKEVIKKTVRLLTTGFKKV